MPNFTLESALAALSEELRTLNTRLTVITKLFATILLLFAMAFLAIGFWLATHRPSPPRPPIQLEQWI
jgi:hypothetical protein